MDFKEYYENEQYFSQLCKLRQLKFTRFICPIYLVYEESCCSIVSYDWANSGSVGIFFRHGTVSGWLLWLNLGVWGEHLTSQLSWVADWLSVMRVGSVCLMEEHCYFWVIYLLLGGWWTEKGGRVVGWENGKGGG